MNTAVTHPAPEEIMAFFDHQLAVEIAESLSLHFDQCPECSAVLSNLSFTSHALSGWRVPPISPQLSERILHNEDRIRSGLSVKKASLFIQTAFWSWKQWSIGFATALASLLLLVAVSGPNLSPHRPAISPVTVDDAQVSGQAAQLSRHDSLVVTRSDLSSPPADARAFPDVRTKQLVPHVGRAMVDLSTALVQQREGIVGGTVEQPQAPMIARSASLTLVVKDFAGARVALDTILARHHAYAADLKASTVENAPRSLVAFLRVPAQDLGPTLTELKSLGRLQEETQNAEEVTQKHADLVARLKNSRETEQRLQTILAQRAGKMSDVLEVEQEIARVRGEIESMEAEQKTLVHRVDYASVNLILTEVYQAQLAVPPISANSRLRNALINGYRNAGETVLGIILFFAEYGPTLIIWLANLAIPVWLLRRRYRRSLASI